MRILFINPRPACHETKEGGEGERDTGITSGDLNSLSRVKAILEDFGSISGLECNVEKTLLMQVGSNLPIDPEIVQLGFDIRDEITLLGLIIQKDTGLWGKKLPKNQQCHKKEINFWLLFNLSLPGRIAISKTMLYSQLNYLASFLPLNDTCVSEWSDLIENYVLGPLNISKNRRYLQNTNTNTNNLFPPFPKRENNYDKKYDNKLIFVLVFFQKDGAYHH